MLVSEIDIAIFKHNPNNKTLGLSKVYFSDFDSEI